MFFPMLTQPTTFLICLVWMVSSFAQLVIGNGSCQMYGHSCLGGHGKRSAPDLNSLASSSQSSSVGLAAGAGLPDSSYSSIPVMYDLDDDAAAMLLAADQTAATSDLQQQKSIGQKLRDRLMNALSPNLARENRRIEQYRLWKRFEPLLNWLNSAEQFRSNSNGLKRSTANKLKRDESTLENDSLTNQI